MSQGFDIPPIGQVGLFRRLDASGIPRFIRFHAFQSIFFFVAVVIVSVAMTFIAVIPFLGVLLWALVYLAELIVWVLLLIKAYNGQIWKLPVIGDIAEKQADAM